MGQGACEVLWRGGGGSVLLHLFNIMMITTTLQCVSSSAPVLVHAPWGALQGVRLQGDGGRKMTAYLGIPYAVPPLGELRYERPKPHPGPGQHVFVADSIMPACPQRPVLIGSRATSEDCLMLDVYVPAQDDPDSARTHAVMVFIHGGGLFTGDAFTYRPSKLVVDGNVIVVVIQYRLGVLGFLTSGDDALPGNLGLWDQNLALRWVKDNVQAFGGDPDRITIFGESAGSWSVGYHLLMPRSKGLFHRAIMQSGAPQNLDRYVDFVGGKSVFNDLSEVLGCQGDSRQRLQCLKQQPVDRLMNRSLEFEKKYFIANCYFPVADGELIPRRGEELLRDPSFLENNAGHVDLIVGFNKNEGALIFFRNLDYQAPDEVLYSGDFFRSILDFCFTFRGLSSSDTSLKKITEFYYRGADYRSNMSRSLDPVVNLYGDCHISASVAEWTRYLTAAPHSAARYLYIVDHDFAFNSQGLVPGAHHGDELMLLFDLERQQQQQQQQLPEDNMLFSGPKTSLSEEEHGLSAQMVNVWTTFAKTGDPSSPLTEALGGGQWPQFSLQQEHYLSFSTRPRVVSSMAPYDDRLALWLTLLPQLDAMTSQPQNTDQLLTPPSREDL